MTEIAFSAPYSAQAQYLDGETSQPHAASLSVTAEGHLEIAPRTGREILWPLDEIRLLPDQAGQDITAYQLASDPVQRLLMTDRSLLPMLPYPRKRQPVTNLGRIFKWAGAAIVSVALIIFVLVPVMADQLAEFIPPEGEKALGEVTLGQIQSALDETGFGEVAICDAPDGTDALNRMQRRLTSSLDLPQDLTVLVLDHGMVNAFALPGGYVVFFRGLIEEAETAEEVAAVFAHEIGHVVSRDPTRNALRSAGSIGVLGLIFGDFAGGAMVLFLTERLIEASYTRDAEAKADLFAHDLLMDAKVPPSALADMFQRLLDKHGEADEFVAHFLSHPSLGDRIEQARDATPNGFDAEPVLSPSEWSALRAICG